MLARNVNHRRITVGVSPRVGRFLSSSVRPSSVASSASASDLEADADRVTREVAVQDNPGWRERASRARQLRDLVLVVVPRQALADGLRVVSLQAAKEVIAGAGA